MKQGFKGLRIQRNHTSWATQVTAREVERPCPAQYAMFRFDIWTRWWPCINRQSKRRPLKSMSESYGRYYDPKKDKRARKTILLTLTTSSGVSHRLKSFMRIKYITRATDLPYILCSYCILAKHRCTTQLLKLSFYHSVVRTHSWRFSIW